MKLSFSLLNETGIIIQGIYTLESVMWPPNAVYCLIASSADGINRGSILATRLFEDIKWFGVPRDGQPRLAPIE